MNDKVERLTSDKINEKLNAIQLLKSFFPNVFIEDKIDFDTLKSLLIDQTENSNEKYQFSWNGKYQSIRNSQKPSIYTLRPNKENSYNWDETENLYIEGDNFEVLRILQKTYYKKIKMIYIDPPYNTGNDYIYVNDFSEDKQEYLDKTNQQFRKNPESSGRLHTDWLNMMYPRILLARNLLKDDGVMAITIDHYELANLIKITDEIFGEDNRLGIITVVHKPEGRNQEKFFGTSNEFMIVYAKEKSQCNFNKVVLDEEQELKFDMSDEKGKYYLKNFIRLTDGKYSLRVNKPSHYYPIYVSQDLEEFSVKKMEGYYEVFPITKNGDERTWKTKEDTFLELVRSNSIVAQKENGNIILYEKLRENQVIKTHWIKKEYHAYHFGTKMIEKLLEGKYFDFPKSLYAVKDILKLTTSGDDIILDFFSGSATTAHAVMKLNAEDGGKRKFIMVQIPVETDVESDAFKDGYTTICDIGRKRIKRASEEIENSIKEHNLKNGIIGNIVNTNLDTGFKVFKLDTSNFRTFDSKSKDIENIFNIDIFNANRNQLDILYEILLKYGVFDKTIETLNFNGTDFYSISNNFMLVFINQKLDNIVIKEICRILPKVVVIDERCFLNDNEKINTLIQLNNSGISDIKFI